jgi:O-antigen/teichoic acid export membrane protein
VAIVVIVGGLIPVAPKIIIFTVLIAILENYADTVYENMNSLNQQVRASVFYFVRAGLWVIPVVLLGWYDPAWRNVNVILVAWAIGVFTSLIVAFWFCRGMPWRQAMHKSIDWHWLRNGLKKSSLVWLGNMGTAIGSYVDRFVVGYYLNLADAGVLAFYFSFTNALLTLMHSGILTFTYPRLITSHRNGRKEEFRHEVQKATWQVAVSSAIVALVLAIGVPVFGAYIHRPQLVNSAPTLWLMLIGTWIRSIAYTVSYVLYARHQDRAIWLGNLLFLIPALGGNALLVPLFGLPGAGLAAIAASSFLLLWRFYHSRQYVEATENVKNPKKPE